MNPRNCAYILAIIFLSTTLYALFLGYSVNYRDINYFVAIWLLLLSYKGYLDIRTNKLFIPKKSIVLFFMACLISLLYSTYAQYYSFEVPGYDLSIFETMLQQMLQGNFGYSTFVGFYHFSTHQNYILLLVLPFYALFKSVLFLEFLAAFLIWSSGVMLWHVAKSETNNSFFAIVIVLAFYLCPGINNAFQTNFRPELFYPLLIFCLYYTYKYSPTIVFTLILLVFLSVREEAPIYLLGFIYLALKDKEYKKFIIILIMSGTMLIINLLIIQPYFTTKSHMLMPNTLHYWSQWGTSKYQIMYNMLTHPQQILTKVFAEDSGIWNVYLSILCLPLLDVFTLLTSIPIILMLCTSNVKMIYHLDLYYAICLTTMIFIGLIRIKKRYANTNALAIPLTAMVIIYPLIGAGWLGMKAINQEEINHWKQLKTLIHAQYSNYPICPYTSLYPYFSIYEFNMPNYYAFNDMKSSCIRIFTTKDWDEIRHEMVIQKSTCKYIGEFVYCVPSVSN